MAKHLHIAHAFSRWSKAVREGNILAESSPFFSRSSRMTDEGDMMGWVGEDQGKFTTTL